MIFYWHNFRIEEPKGADCWWRAEDRRYADYDPWAEFEQPNSSHLVIHVLSYPVESYTRTGVWLNLGFGSRRFVQGNTRKQFALPTIELALRDLVVRKSYHVSGAEARLARAREHLAAAEKCLASVSG